MPNKTEKFDENFPNWVYAIGGLIIVGVAYQTGSKVGAYMVALVVIVMMGKAYRKGVISNGRIEIH